MVDVEGPPIWQVIPVLIAGCLFTFPAWAVCHDGSGRTTAETPTARTFLGSGGPFVGKNENVMEDI